MKPDDRLINWGSSQSIGLGPVYNQPATVGLATNKLLAFQVMVHHGVQTVDWTDSRDVAQKWSNKEHTVVVRNKLTGHSGEGILIVEPCHEVPSAPLYTKYVFKEKEFRVHVVLGQAVDTQRKIKDPTREVITWKVRSHDNGFIYVRENIVPDAARDALAIATVHALELDFGAVDIIQDKNGKYYVLEVNTAPGIVGQTVMKYADAFRNAL